MLVMLESIVTTGTVNIRMAALSLGCSLVRVR